MGWHYVKGGRQEGPVTAEELRERLGRAEVSPDDLVWMEGMENWQPAGTVSELSPVAGSSPVPGSGSVPAGDSKASPEPASLAPIPAGAPLGATDSAPEPEGEAAGGEQSVLPGLVAPPRTCGMAIASMSCGIVSLLLCWIWAVAGIPAVICGHLALRKIGKSAEPLDGRGMALSGMIIGYLAIVLQIASIGVLIWVAVRGR